MAELLRSLYNVLFLILIPLLLLRIYWRERHYPLNRRRWHERFAWRLPDAPKSSPIWIHAVSVGEAVAASPIVEHLRERYPATPILFSTTTATGAIATESRFGDSIVHVLFPYDIPSVVSKFMSHYSPQMLILMETELWPNLLRQCAHREIPVVLANARLSQKSASRYKYIAFHARQMLTNISWLGAQTTEDRERFIDLGADPRSVYVTGSVKFDVQLPPSASEAGQALRRFFGVNRTVLIAGSTREGEEEILLKAFAKAANNHPGLLLLIAPRHPERFERVHDLCRRLNFHTVKHSAANNYNEQIEVYVIDSIGELPKFYAASDIAFVGGSMVPRGGHNVLEPAALGVPVIVGPHTQNFSEIVNQLYEANALYIARDSGSLEHVTERLLDDSNLRDKAGAAGKNFVAQNKGATVKIVRIVDKMLRTEGSPTSLVRSSTS